MRKGVVIAIAVGVVALVGWAGWRIVTGQKYAENFRKSFAEECTTKLEALGAGDQVRHQKVLTACQCSAEGSYEEFKDLPVTEQYAQLQTPEMQHKIGAIVKACAQQVGLQLGSGSQ